MTDSARETVRGLRARANALDAYHDIEEMRFLSGAADLIDRLQALAARQEGVNVLREAMQDAVDLLIERTHGHSARSPGHNARLCLEAALAAAPQRRSPTREEIARAAYAFECRYETRLGSRLRWEHLTFDERKDYFEFADLLTSAQPAEEWRTIKDEHPRPHARYEIRRDNRIYTATPCYGMHHPWWVPMKIDGKEGDPVLMLDTDEWRPLPSPPAVIAEQEGEDATASSSATVPQDKQGGP